MSITEVPTTLKWDIWKRLRYCDANACSASTDLEAARELNSR